MKVACKRVMVAFQRKREHIAHTDRRIIKYIHMHILIDLIDLILSWELGPPDPRLLPCEIQPAKKRKSTPPGSFSILGRLGNLGRPLSSCARNAAKCSSCRG